MSSPENRAARCFINAAGFHAHKTVLHHVHPADTVGAGNLVQWSISLAGLIFLPLTATGLPFSKSISRYVGLSGASSGRSRQDKHILRRFRPGILQNAAFMRNMEQIAVAAVGLCVASQAERESCACRVIQHRSAGIEGPVVIFPGGDDANMRIQGHIGQLKADLIVAFARCPVADGVRTFQPRDFHLPFGDQRPGQRGPQQISPS